MCDLDLEVVSKRYDLGEGSMRFEGGVGMLNVWEGEGFVASVEEVELPRVALVPFADPLNRILLPSVHIVTSPTCLSYELSARSGFRELLP